MARIKKDDHARILHLVDIDRRPVREIASEYGCSPANIYTLLTKLRRGANSTAVEEGKAQQPLALEEGVEPEAVAPVAAPPVIADAAPPVLVLPAHPAEPQPDRTVVNFERTAAAPTRTEPSRPEPSKLGAKLAKPGMGLVMRTADGEETMTPFRSIDDLLSAIKPSLRASARSAEPVWFSLQPVDLSTIDVDAA
jgi:hypothetical protein